MGGATPSGAQGGRGILNRGVAKARIAAKSGCVRPRSEPVSVRKSECGQIFSTVSVAPQVSPNLSVVLKTAVGVKAHRGFESHPLRHRSPYVRDISGE
jgi:hypothetical protein